MQSFHLQRYLRYFSGNDQNVHFKYMEGRHTFFFQLHIFLSNSNTEFSFLCYSLKVLKWINLMKSFIHLKLLVILEIKIFHRMKT